MEYFIAPVRPEQIEGKDAFAIVSLMASNADRHQVEVTYFLDGQPQHKEGFNAQGSLQEVYAWVGERLLALPPAQTIMPPSSNG